MLVLALRLHMRDVNSLAEEEKTKLIAWYTCCGDVVVVNDPNDAAHLIAGRRGRGINHPGSTRMPH
jgi:hypothetical protein